MVMMVYFFVLILGPSYDSFIVNGPFADPVSCAEWSLYLEAEGGVASECFAGTPKEVQDVVAPDLGDMV